MAVIEYVDRAEAENLASEANILVLTGLSILFVFSNNRFVKTCNMNSGNIILHKMALLLMISFYVKNTQFFKEISVWILFITDKIF